MPLASDFRKAFNLNKGAAVYSLQGKNNILVGEVQSSSIGHTTKKKNELYEFPSSVEVKVKDKAINKRSLEAAFKEYVKGEQIVYSAYGSPYACSVAKIKISSFDLDEDHASFTFLGKAIRRRDIPTLGQQKEEERKKEATAAKKRKTRVPTKHVEISKEGTYSISLLPNFS
jgi:hypothetical protein